MSENPNFVVQLFIRTLEIKHKLTFEKDKEEYFRVLFDTYLNGQGNPDQLKEYIAAGIEDQRVIDIIAEEVVQWQAKAVELKAAEQAKRSEKQAEKEKIEAYVNTKTKKVKEQAEKGEKQKQKGEKVEEHGRKRHKGERVRPAAVGEQGGDVKGEGRGLKFQLSQQGKQKCKFYPFCKNVQTCQYYHPVEKRYQKIKLARVRVVQNKLQDYKIKKQNKTLSPNSKIQKIKYLLNAFIFLDYFIKCTYFPNCRYGESCLYEHEACKFKEKCTKINCPFAHPFKKSNPIQEMMKSFMTQHNPLSRQKKNRFHQKPKEQGQGGQGVQQQQPEEPKKE